MVSGTIVRRCRPRSFSSARSQRPTIASTPASILDRLGSAASPLVGLVQRHQPVAVALAFAREQLEPLERGDVLEQQPARRLCAVARRDEDADRPGEVQADRRHRLAGLERRAHLGDRRAGEPLRVEPRAHLPVALEQLGTGRYRAVHGSAARGGVELALEREQVAAGRIRAQRRAVAPAQAAGPVERAQHAVPVVLRAPAPPRARRPPRPGVPDASFTSSSVTAVR